MFFMSQSKDIYDDTAEVDRYGMITYSHYLPDREKYYTQYDVKVQASNAMGPGPNTSVEVIYSAEDRKLNSPVGQILFNTFSGHCLTMCRYIFFIRYIPVTSF